MTHQNLKSFNVLETVLSHLKLAPFCIPCHLVLFFLYGPFDLNTNLPTPGKGESGDP